MKLRFLIPIALILLARSFSAFAASSIIPVGAVTYSRILMTGVPNSQFSDARIGFGGGVLIETTIMPRTGFELGGLFLNRAFRDSARGMLRTGVIEVPVLLRHWLTPGIGVGIGAYGSIPTGYPSPTMRSTASGQGIKYADYGIRPIDWGWQASLRLDFGGLAFAGPILDARLGQSLRNLAMEPAPVRKSVRDIQLLAGIRFSL